MDCTFESFNLDSVDHHYDPNEYFKQQKEIDGILSTAFDDLSSISDESSESNDDNANNNINVKMGSSNAADSKYSYSTNHLSHSTPIRSLIPNNYSNPRKSRRDISDILEEDLQNCHEFGSVKSDVSLSDGDEMQTQDLVSNRYNTNKSNLIDNSKLSTNVFQLKEKCSKLNSNNDLHNKFEELHKVNGTNLQTIERLQTKIRFLENQAKEEKLEKYNMSKKVAILESTVESLEYQLNEIGKGDFIARTNDVNAHAITNLKQKHDKELNALQSEIENLTQTLLEKEEIILSKDSLIQRYEKEFGGDSSRFKQMVQMTKEMLNKEMEENMEKEIKYIKEKTETNLLNSFDQSINRLKDEWQQKLKEDVDKIVLWIDNNINDINNLQNKDTIDQDQHLLDLDIKFKPLTDICISLKNSVNNRENKIQLQVEKLQEAKYQLEEALLESRMSSSNISTASDRSQLLDELKYELNQVKQESQSLTLKLQKYKQHYHLLAKRHKHEVDSLKAEFIERLRNNSNYSLI